MTEDHRIALFAPLALDLNEQKPFLTRTVARFREEWGRRRGVFLGAHFAAIKSAEAVLQYRTGPVSAIVDPRTPAVVRRNLGRTLRSSMRVEGTRDVSTLEELTARKEPVHVLDTKGISRHNIFNTFGYRANAVLAQSSITLLHHAVSYRADLYMTFLPLVLAKTKACDVIACSSSASKSAIGNLLTLASDYVGSHHRYRGRLEVIPYCVDDDVYVPLDRKQCRVKVGLPQDAFIFLVFGRISAADKADLMPVIIAFAVLRKSLPVVRRNSLRLVIAGNDREGYASILKTVIKQLGLEDGVSFLHSVGEDLKPQLYNSADVFCSLADNIQECFGLVAAEAMSCGIPQIVSAWSGYKEIVVDGITGFMVDTLWSRCDEEITRAGALNPEVFLYDHFHLAQSVAIDIKRLVWCMQRLVENEALRADMRKNSLERARSEYTKAVMIERLNRMWRESEEIMESERVRGCLKIQACRHRITSTPSITSPRTFSRVVRPCVLARSLSYLA